MGSNQSVQAIEDEEEDEEEEEEDEEEENVGNSQRDPNDVVEKKLLEQEPEMLPCYASASPLSPQLSSLGTPRMGPSIKVWDPYNVLAPPPPLPPPPAVGFGRSYSSDGMVVMEEDNRGGGLGLMEVYLISHGESEMSLRPDLVGGRCNSYGLTANGKRQARALAVFLNSQGVRFNAVYCSPLDRAKATAVSVCQELSFPDDQIRPMDVLSDMSQGQWEGLPRSEVYTPEILTLIDRLQPDFSPPSGESLRQVEFRMVEFLHQTLLSLPDKLKPIHDHRDREVGPAGPPPQWDLLRHRQLSRKKSGKSRLQVVTTTLDHNHYTEPEEMSSSPKEPSSSHRQNSISMTSSSTSCVGVFTHSVPIKCLLTAILGCSPVMSHKLCVEDSSVTVLQHSWKTGWQIKRLNETGHLRLL